MTNKARRKRKKPKKHVANEDKRVRRDADCNQSGVGTASNDIDASDQFGEPSLEPKHKLFLSHSGADKDFTWQLCEDLERIHHFPFFDKRPDSLPKGEHFPPLITKAAKECRVAILVLSEESFTRSKWPMTELNEFVKAQEMPNSRLKILPLFLGLTLNHYKEKTRQQGWVRKWREMAREDERINVGEWEHALSRIPGMNAMEYAGVSEGHVSFRKKVVAAVCRLLPPDVKWDVSHVQSMESLCMPILNKCKEVEPCGKCGVRVVGIYGMGGVGKTTISQAVCNHMVGDFDGKVCHVEFGGPNLVELMKRVLKELTEASPNILDHPGGKLVDLLNARMCRQKVFLVLDNVWEHQKEDAQQYLAAGYHKDSIVLVTARSLDILVKLLQIPESNCLKMPELDDNGAFDLLVHYSKVSVASLSEDDRRIVWNCVELCRFHNQQELVSSSESICTYHYLPLALKALGSQLGDMNQDASRWEDTLMKLKVDKSRADKYNILKNKIHPIYSVLRLGYDALLQEEQHIFLDMALILDSKHAGYTWISYKWEWLCAIYRRTKDDITESLIALRKKGILEAFSEDRYHELKFRIHDLYLDFAKYEDEVRPFKEKRFLFDESGSEVSHVLMKHQFCSSLERLIIRNSKVQSLSEAMLHVCSNVEVLELFGCDDLTEVDIRGMKNLRSIVVWGNPKLGPGLMKGVVKLNNLVWLKLTLCKSQESEFIQGVSSLTALHCLNIRPSGGQELDFSLLNLSGCKSMRVLSLGDVDMGSSLIRSMKSLTNLQELTLLSCSGDWSCLGKLISLQMLSVNESDILELPDLRKLKKLWFLDVNSCCELVSIAGIALATALRELVAYSCTQLWKLPNDWSGLEHLETVDLSGCTSLHVLPNDLSGLEHLNTVNLLWCHSISVLPVDYERLVARDILKVERCWGLVVPLVKELQRQLPEISQVEDHGRSDGCVSWCEQSMQSWINAMKDVRCAYKLLRNVYSTYYSEVYYWSFLFDEEVDDFIVRALYEHLSMWGDENLSILVEGAMKEDIPISGVTSGWVFVATAPCTFGLVTEKAISTSGLLDYVSRYFLNEIFVLDEDGYMAFKDEYGPFAKLGFKVVIRKCREIRQNAIDQGINLVHSLDEAWTFALQLMEAACG